MTLVDSGVNHNCVSTRGVTRLCLQLIKDDSKLKVVNN